MPIFLENFSSISCKKLLYPGPHLILITPASKRQSAHQRTTWLVRVRMFLQYKCLLKNTLVGHGPPLTPSANTLAQLVKIPL